LKDKLSKNEAVKLESLKWMSLFFNGRICSIRRLGHARHLEKNDKEK
jgi:hypothetical protein